MLDGAFEQEGAEKKRKKGGGGGLGKGYSRGLGDIYYKNTLQP